MRIAAPFWGGRISPVLDVAKKYLLAEVEDGQVASTQELTITGVSPQQCAEILWRNKVVVLICGAISEEFFDLLNSHDIEVYPWCAGNVDEIIQAFISDTISEPRFRMPGCGSGNRQRRRQRHGWRRKG